MKKSSEIRAEMRKLSNQIEGIVALATREERELTKEEMEIVDRIQGIGDDHGEIKALEADLERAVRMESRLREVGSTLFGGSDNNGKGNKMTNRHGRSVTVLNKGESYAATVNSEVTKVPFAMGEAARVAVCGFNRHTPDAIRNAMESGSNERGGYMVPTEVASDLIDKARAQSVIMEAGARTVVMNAPELLMTTVETDPTFEVHRESTTITESDITLGQHRLGAYTIVTLIKSPRELVEDAPNFAAQVEEVMARSLAIQLDYYALVGGTNNQPMGLLQNNNISETGSIGAIDWADLSTATTTIREANYEPNAYIMAPSIHDALFNIETGDGTNSARGWLDAPPSIRGKQYLHTTNMPTTGIVLGDFTNFSWGVRQQAQIEVSTTGGDAFETHSVYIKIHWRGDFIASRPAAFHRLADVTAS